VKRRDHLEDLGIDGRIIRGIRIYFREIGWEVMD
jgi:hypothetical protein